MMRIDLGMRIGGINVYCLQCYFSLHLWAYQVSPHLVASRLLGVSDSSAVNYCIRSFKIWEGATHKHLQPDTFLIHLRME